MNIQYFQFNLNVHVQVEFCKFTSADDEIDGAKPLLHEQTSSVKQTHAQLSEGTLILSPKVRLEVTESEVCLRPIGRSPPQGHTVRYDCNEGCYRSVIAHTVKTS